MDIQVYVGRDVDGDMAGKLHVHIVDDYSSGYKVYVSSVEQAAEEVKQYIIENYQE